MLRGLSSSLIWTYPGGQLVDTSQYDFLLRSQSRGFGNTSFVFGGFAELIAGHGQDDGGYQPGYGPAHIAHHINRADYGHLFGHGV